MRKLIPLLLLLVSMPSLAQRQFDIEVIIFKRLVNAEQVNENWSDTLTPIDMSKVGTFSSKSYLNLKKAQMLPRSSYKLNDEVKTLQDHAGFKVLLHKAWRQGDQGKSAAPVFHILAGKDYSAQFDANGEEKSASLPDDEISDKVQQVSAKATPIRELDGKLQIYVQHYLYAETTLDLLEPTTKTIIVPSEENADEQTNSDDQINTSDDSKSDSVQVGYLESVNVPTQTKTVLKTYRMEQKRRMRSNETHYLDNPLLGMIIQVRRVNR